MWRTTHIGYELYGHRCVPKRPQITFKPVYCSKFETFKDQRINECDFSRIYFRKFVSNCRCVDRFVRKAILHYKCCQKPIISKRCVNHNARVVVTTNYKLVNFKCYPVGRESRSTVDCSHLKHQKRINTSQCTYKIEYYYGSSKHCACYRALKFTRFNLKSCCHHLRPAEYQKCDKKRGLLIKFKRRYVLVKHKCLPKTLTIEKPINCDGRICERKYGKCIRNTRTIELFCLKRQGCKCVKQIFTRRNVCCGPNKDSTWTKIGPCTEKGGYYKLITTYALQLNYRINQCTPVVIKQQYQICRCRKSFVEKSCFKNIYIKTRKVSFKIYKPKNVCHKRIDESISIVSECYKTLNIVINEKETKPDGWCIRTSQITTPVNCKCLETIEKTRFQCPCYKPVPVKIKTYCRNNFIIVVERHIPKCRLNKIYWRIDRTFTPIVKCSHKQILYGPTFYSSRYRGHVSIRFCTKIRFETHVQWYVDKCVCKSKIIKEKPICTECLPPRQIEHCLGSKINVISYSHSIVDGNCRRTVNRKLIHIPCPSQPKIHQSKCINNKYTITTTNYFHDNCRCKSRVEKKTCHCQCGKDSKVKKCSRNYFFNEVTIKYIKRDCRCFKTVNVKQIPPICPRFIHLTIEKCEIRKHHSIYQKITRRYIKRNNKNCKCKILSKTKFKVCDCKKQRIKRNVCTNNNNFIIQTWGWRINVKKNKCDKVILNTDSKLISCPPTKINKVCNFNIGRGKEITTKYKLVNCKCIENKIVRRIPCICDTRLVLERRGSCRMNIFRIDVYSHKEARGKHCVTVKVRKYIICRCHLEESIRKCINNRVVHIRTYFILINNVCQKRNIARYDSVFCTQQVWTVKTKCDARGFKIIKYYGNIVRNCKCVRRRIRVQFCRCRCRPNRTYRKCHSSGKVIINIHISYKLVGCSCITTKTEKIQPIKCPSRTVIVSRCKEVRCKGYWFRTTTVTNYHTRYCICVRNVKRIKSICKIKIFKEVSVTCDRRRRIVIIKVSKLIFKNGKCIKITKEKRIPITCNNRWVIINRPICHLDGTEIRIYQRLYFKDCRCRSERKVKRCKCRCKRPFVVRKCIRNTIRLYYYRYALRQCKCNRKLIRVQTKRIYCKSKILKVGPCFEKNNHCVRNAEYQQSVLINCQCIKRRRIIQRICHSCCHHLTKFKNHCKECPPRIITKITSCRVNHYGRIVRVSSVTSKGISCKEGTTCVSQKDCNRLTSTETFKCTTKAIKRCMCVLKKTFIKKDLCKCGPTKLKTGSCSLKSCKRAVYQIERKLVILRNNKKTCQKVVRKLRDEICCCPKSKVTKKCINNRLNLKTKKYTFNKAKKICKLRINVKDITRKCGPKREIKETSYSRTFRKKIIIITKRLVNCKCITRKTIKWELHRCPGSITETKCVRNKLETNRHKYTINNKKNKCVLTVNKRIKKIRCPPLPRELYRYNIKYPRQCGKRIYKIHNCRCILVIITRPCPCFLSCPKDTITQSCITRHGIYRIVRRSYKFNREGCKCIVIIRTKDKQIRCARSPRNVIVRAAKVYQNGIYDSVTSFVERRHNCACIKQSSTRFVLNRCYYGYRRTGSQCRKRYVPPKNVFVKKPYPWRNPWGQKHIPTRRNPSHWRWNWRRNHRNWRRNNVNWRHNHIYWRRNNVYRRRYRRF